MACQNAGNSPGGSLADLAGHLHGHCRQNSGCGARRLQVLRVRLRQLSDAGLLREACFAFRPACACLDSLHGPKPVADNGGVGRGLCCAWAAGGRFFPCGFGLYRSYRNPYFSMGLLLPALRFRLPRP